MAEASQRHYGSKDLSQCGICLMEIEQSKALPCLHCFCSKCVAQWAHLKNKVMCPLCTPCRGVSSFRTNFFVDSPKDRAERIETKQSKDTVAHFGNCEVDNIGSIPSCSRRVRVVGVWKLHKTFIMLGRAKNISFIHKSNFVILSNMTLPVLNTETLIGLYEYDKNGQLKSVTRITNMSNFHPSCIRVSQDGRVFVANKTYVNVFDKDMTLKQQFAARSPDGVSLDSQYTYLGGIAFDNHSMLLVGECSQKYISKHRLDGTHVMSFKVTIRPTYIAVSSQDKVIVSTLPLFGTSPVHILDEHGNHLHTLEPPPGLSVWHPRGVCCTSDDEVYIANQSSPGSIDIYSTESGGYIGCLTKDVTYPMYLALMDDEDKLVVLDDRGYGYPTAVKIFQQEYQ